MYKRKLLAMSALTGALALAGSGALADGKPVPIKLLLSGKFEVLGGYAAQRQSFEKSSDADVDGTTHYGALNILSSSEIHVTGSTRLENGLTVSVVVEFEGDQFTHNGSGSDNAIDKSYLAVAGSFGQIRIGSTNAGSHDLVNTAPNVGALSHDGGDTDDWILQPGNSAVGGPDTDIGAGDITRIAYVSQEIGGFTLGASYQPTAATTETMPAIGGNSGADAQTYDIGIAYAGMFGQAAFSADVQYYRVQGGAAVSVESWRGGANLRLGRLALGGSYRRLRDTASGVSGTAASSDEDAWEIGFTYAGSGWSAGLAMATANRPLSNAVPGGDSVTKYVLGVSYNISTGVDLLGSIAHVVWQDELTADSNNNSGFAVVTGIAVTF